MSRLTLTCAVFLGTLLVGAGQAAADYERTFTPDIEFHRQNKPGDPGNCALIAVAPFPAIQGATSAAATFTYVTPTTPAPETRTTVGPAFDDTVRYLVTFTAPAGTHWVLLSTSAIDGAPATDCSELEQKARAIMSRTATVVVKIAGDSPGCKTAKKARKTADATVAARRKALAKAEGTAAKRRAAQRLAKAKTKAKAAKRKQDKACAP